MRGAKTALLVLFFSIVPYALMAWAWAAMTDGRANAFWTALGALIVARIFFVVIEWIGRVISWHLYGRQFTVNWLVSAFRHPKVQPNEMADDEAIFRFEALPVHMQVEMLRWVVGEGLMPEGRTEDVIQTAIARCWPHKQGASMANGG
jgi:hypothetical protein